VLVGIGAIAPLTGAFAGLQAIVAGLLGAGFVRLAIPGQRVPNVQLLAQFPRPARLARRNRS